MVSVDSAVSAVSVGPVGMVGIQDPVMELVVLVRGIGRVVRGSWAVKSEEEEEEACCLQVGVLLSSFGGGRGGDEGFDGGLRRWKKEKERGKNRALLYIYKIRIEKPGMLYYLYGNDGSDVVQREGYMLHCTMCPYCLVTHQEGRIISNDVQQHRRMKKREDEVYGRRVGKICLSANHAGQAL